MENLEVRVAAPNAPKVKPAFRVERRNTTVNRTKRVRDGKGNLVTKVLEEPYGYHVTFSKGHSIRVPTDAELARLGFDKTIPLVKDGEDEPVDYMENMVKEDAE